MQSAAKTVLALLFLVLIRSAHADQVSYQQGAVPDPSYQHLGSTIFQNNPDKNDGARSLIGVGEASHAPDGVPGFLGHIRGVLAFDLANLPTGTIINSVALKMTVAEIEGDGDPGHIDLYGIAPTETMVEGSGIYSVGPNNGVTWNNAGPGDPWTTGGDYLPTVLASIHPTAIGPVTFGPTPELTSAAQSALDNGRPLQLLLIASQAELAHNAVDVAIFHSDDAPVAANRPKLNIEYTIPEPTSWLPTLFLMTTFLIHRQQRRISLRFPGSLSRSGNWPDPQCQQVRPRRPT